MDKLQPITFDIKKDQMEAVFKVAWRVAQILFVMWSINVFNAAGFPGFARAGEQVSLDKRLQSVETTIQFEGMKRERDTLTAWISELSRDSFDLDREIEGMDKAPERYLRQRDRMHADKETAERRLMLLLQANPELVTR